MPRTHITYCRNCPSLCGLLMDVEDNKIVDVRGDREHPLTRGYFCIKGLASKDWQNGEDRLLHATRLQADGARAHVEIEAALDDIYARLDAILKRHGPGAVALYYGTGCNNNSVSHSAVKGWMHLIGSPYIFSSMTVDQSAKWVALARMGIFATGKYSALDADVILEVGVNTAISHTSNTVPMSNPMQRLRDLQKRGLKLISVDPRRTETARRADIHLQVKPGEDATLFAGMIRLLLEHGWHDRDFCERFVGPLEPLRAAVGDFHLDYVAERAGVGADQIVAAVEMFSRAKRKSTGSGTGPDMSRDSNTAEHLIEAFNALCGGYRRAGDVIRNIQPLFGNPITREMVFPANRSWERAPHCRAVPAGRLFGEFPSAVLPRDILHDGEDRIRALIVVGGNPAKAIPDPDLTLAAFERLELMVTLDPRPTDTTALSHYAIPTALPYERHDYTGIYDNISAFSFVQTAAPVVERPAGIIDDIDFFWGLARRMGKALPLKPPTFGVAHEDIAGPTLDLNPATPPRVEDIIRAFTSRYRFNYDDLAAEPRGILLEETLTIAAAGEDDGARLELCAPDVADEIAAIRRRERDDDSTFPYRLIVRRQMESMNSAYSNAALTRRRHQTNPAYMHPDDMADAGLGDGDRIRISSANGAVFSRAAPDSTLRRGVISMTHAWGAANDRLDPRNETGAYTGRLISIQHDLQPINYMPRLSAVPVAIALAP